MVKGMLDNRLVRKQFRPRFRKKTCPYCGRSVSFAHGGNYYRHLDACEVRHEKTKTLRTPCCNSFYISQDGRTWICRKCQRVADKDELKTIRTIVRDNND